MLNREDNVVMFAILKLGFGGYTIHFESLPRGCRMEIEDTARELGYEILYQGILGEVDSLDSLSLLIKHANGTGILDLRVVKVLAA